MVGVTRHHTPQPTLNHHDGNHNSTNNHAPSTLIRTRAQHRRDETTINPKQPNITPPPPPTLTVDQDWDTNVTLSEVPFERYTSALQRLPLKVEELLPDTATWKASGEWTNLDIDAITQQVQASDTSTSILSSMFLLEAQKNPQRARTLLKSAQVIAGDGPIHMICWIRSHWLLATFRGTKMQVADSHPGIATPADLRTIADFTGAALGKQFTLEIMRVPKQPKGSVECGAHTVCNTILAHKGWLWPKDDTDRSQRTLSYATMFEALKLYADGELRLEYIRERILDTLGENNHALPTHSQILKHADAATDKRITVRWMRENGMAKWTGRLVKRNPTHWVVKYDEMETLTQLPNKEVCYFTIEDKDGVNTHHTHADMLALNVHPPSSTSKVEGDNMSVYTLKQHLAKPRSQPPYNEFFTKAIAATTRRAHLALLNALMTIPDRMDKHMVTEALPNFIQTLKEQRTWRASTVLTKLAALQGALKILSFYIPTAPSIILSSSTRWKTTMRGAAIAANEETPNQCRPTTSQDIYKLMEQTTDNQLYTFLEVTWLTAGRVGDTIQLTPSNVIISPEDITIIHFTTGKTARNGKYSVAAPALSDRAKLFLQEQRNQPFLFPSVTQERVRGALRSIDIRYECRSIRRGRLQELSAGGMSDNNLLHISRHSSICSLRRYLDFGLASGENLHRAHLAARATIAAQRKLLTGEQLDTYNQMDAETAPPGRRYNVAGQHWPSGSEISSQSSRSSSASAIGDV